MPKLQEIFTTVAIVCLRYERLAVLQNVFAIILLWARKDVEKKNISKKLYSIKLKKKRKSRDESDAWDYKLAQILEQSSATRKAVCVSVSFLFWSLYKTNRFHVAVGLFSDRSQRTSKCGKNNSDTLACGSCATSLLLRHFDVICDLLLNRRTATWNLFVKYQMCHVVLYNMCHVM